LTGTQECPYKREGAKSQNYVLASTSKRQNKPFTKIDDLEWTWPAWKFGLQIDDQFKELQELYNTFPSAIQNPQAFHLDLLEGNNQGGALQRASYSKANTLFRAQSQPRITEL
jgi:hypothetical protein